MPNFKGLLLSYLAELDGVNSSSAVHVRVLTILKEKIKDFESESACNIIHKGFTDKQSFKDFFSRNDIGQEDILTYLINFIDNIKKSTYSNDGIFLNKANTDAILLLHQIADAIQNHVAKPKPAA